MDHVMLDFPKQDIGPPHDLIPVTPLKMGAKWRESLTKATPRKRQRSEGESRSSQKVRTSQTSESTKTTTTAEREKLARTAKSAASTSYKQLSEDSDSDAFQEGPQSPFKNKEADSKLHHKVSLKICLIYIF